MRRLLTFVTSPVLYAAWVLIVLVALTISYFADPYIFAFTTLIAGGICIVIGVIGLPVALLSKTVGWRARTAIILSIALSSAAVVVALAILRTFKWA